MASAKKKICIIGSGNWGSAIAKIVGNNALAMPDKFDTEVRMWVFEEMVKDRKLTEIINQDHENVKYLPGHKLPTNVLAVPGVKETGEGADIFIFVLPHQFVKGVCNQLKGNVKKDAIAVSLIKGFEVKDGGGILLISSVIRDLLNIPCAALMGANIANEVAKENYCEATIGCKHPEYGAILKDMFQADYFRIVVCDDETTVEVCGALKNIVAVGAGFADGLGYGDNTKAAVIRLGLMEMVKFCEIFYPESQQGTFLESCGVADLVTTCYGGRNRRVAEAYAKTGKSIEELEAEMLNGQKLQGPPTAYEVNYMLKAKDMEQRFPLFTAIHNICKGNLHVSKFMDCLKNHPEHM
ncbi:glycerol-3-phosphate dehydrogenase [NAD(+)], cytoplasmic-like [Mizuhopecten yessoensis]|uniref:Glycerol-3-phosphate dehydrogenase [NAD(+)] n=1 Tax=Mizuhopecten yessoensis TaxID=6573 RepID=A0A210Q2T6_MIZYE|nr:glycerol-3-phosphate dehydrogenase [NAD(+)], cytoplasmic-like [Mizuhopecten yessoensis]OWF43025.1 Glycerol-3-phosphate dehydrogenase [NAD(+)], cytoplasmic [Mizuhopecten yessoensis]